MSKPRDVCEENNPQRLLEIAAISEVCLHDSDPVMQRPEVQREFKRTGMMACMLFSLYNGYIDERDNK